MQQHNAADSHQAAIARPHSTLRGRKRTCLGGLALDGLHLNGSAARLCAQTGHSVVSRSVCHFMLASYDTSPGAEQDHAGVAGQKRGRVRRGPQYRIQMQIDADAQQIPGGWQSTEKQVQTGHARIMPNDRESTTGIDPIHRLQPMAGMLTLSLSSGDHDEEVVVVGVEAVGAGVCACKLIVLCRTLF